MVAPGDDLASVLLAGTAAQNLVFDDGDVLVVAQKIVSKAEGRQVRLADVTASREAEILAAETDKDPRIVQLILDESTEVVRKKPGVLIVRQALGIVGAHAGIDQSNIDHGDGDDGESALLLPENPDASAARLHEELRRRTGRHVGVVISDSANRPWRLGTIGIAIGAAGIATLHDRRGGTDLFGRELKVTLINRADSLATAATLVMGETTERIPAAVVKGLEVETECGNAAEILRPLEEDLFR